MACAGRRKVLCGPLPQILLRLGGVLIGIDQGSKRGRDRVIGIARPPVARGWLGTFGSDLVSYVTHLLIGRGFQSTNLLFERTDTHHLTNAGRYSEKKAIPGNIERSRGNVAFVR